MEALLGYSAFCNVGIMQAFDFQTTMPRAFGMQIDDDLVGIRGILPAKGAKIVQCDKFPSVHDLGAILWSHWPTPQILWVVPLLQVMPLHSQRCPHSCSLHEHSLGGGRFFWIQAGCTF